MVSHAVPIIPDNPNLSWASMAMATMVLLDVSTEIGEYHRAINDSWTGSDYRKLRQARKSVNLAALQVVVAMFCFIGASALAVWHLTKDMDWRMKLILEGVNRLEAAWFFLYTCIKTPSWIGVYHSPKKDRRIQHVGKGIRVLRFHVRWSVAQYFVYVYFFLLPFAGKPRSAILGIMIGFLIEGAIFFARKKSAKNQARIAIATAFALAVLSSVLFADGCHYIQVVWGTGIWKNELGLFIITFTFWMTMIFRQHYRLWSETEKRMASHKRFSVHAKDDRMAMTLIMSHMFGSRYPKPGQPLDPSELEKIQEEDSDEDDHAGEEEDSTWTLIKKRCSTPSELVFLTKKDINFFAGICAFSVFLGVVNIFATAQMNVVRQHFHSVHETLYGQMEEGPVCAFDKVGGNISTFESRKAAHTAGYKVAHCGACGACSDWHNLRLQYTTREYLAKESARCARKSLYGGRDAVLNCLGQEPIGFTGKCAECWTEDILCAKGHCAFIFIQSNLINTVTNFQVSEETITSATCEEAMCELEFVPCSGANRRRMSIQSTIKRPGQQLCSIVDVDWAEVFGEEEERLSSGKSGNEEL